MTGLLQCLVKNNNSLQIKFVKMKQEEEASSDI